MVQARVWTLAKKCDGFPKLEDFECKTETLPPCGDGEVVIEAEWLSVDPYMRYRIRASNAGDTVFGSQVARVIESCSPAHPVGSYAVVYPGWRSHTRVTAKQLADLAFYQPLGDLGGARRSTALGVLGMPGHTAYFGFLELCRPKPGETVLVNGGAGAVGSSVIQIAKIKGCRVIAFAGTPEKVAYLKTLGADFAYNYKTDDVNASLTEAAPNGINCYFDNVGGEFSAAVGPHLAEYARVSICGAISTYNDEGKGPGTVSMNGAFTSELMIMKSLRVEGFLVTRWAARWGESGRQMAAWIQEGKLQYQETVTDGFNNLPAAFIGLFAGDNLGKAVVKA